MMNEMPVNWLVELSEAYPKRSGPCGWNGMKMLLCVRRALLESTWIEIMNGVKRYAKFCSQAGKEGTEYVLSPKAFFDDAVYLEELSFQAPQTKEQQELARIAVRDGSRMERACAAGKAFGLSPMAGESVGSFETRVQLAQRDAPTVRGDLGERISSLANRLKQA